jgi:hypothetical protein
VHHTPVYPTILSLVVLSNAVSSGASWARIHQVSDSTSDLLIEPLAKYDEFMHAGLSYVEETLICAEIVRLTPNFLAP